jgi:FixJ family two-component response regulator
MTIAQAARRESIASLPSHAAVPLVDIVDDDAPAREALESLISAAGWKSRTFCCAHDFLRCPRVTVPRCLILDVSLPDLDGLALQERVAADGGETAVIFVATHVEVATVVKAMKRGATEFFSKPFADDALLSAVADAIEQSRAALVRRAETRMLRERYESLSGREGQVLALVVAGRLNKQVAYELAISEVTVKAHRGNMMRKMKARSVPDLVRMIAKLHSDGPSAVGVGVSPESDGFAASTRRVGDRRLEEIVWKNFRRPSATGRWNASVASAIHSTELVVASNEML